MAAYGTYKKTHWDGLNKGAVRAIKIATVVKHYPKLGLFPRCLTFPGIAALFERGLVETGLVRPQDIIGIQRQQSTNGTDNRAIFDALAKTVTARAGNLTGMHVVGVEFKKFSQAMATLSPKDAAQALSKHLLSIEVETTRAFVESMPATFSVVDMDVCCPFDKTLMSSLVELSPLLSDFGVLFITHQKGREKPVSRNLLEAATRSIASKHGLPGGPSYNFLPRNGGWRFVGTPVAYTQAFLAKNIKLRLEKLIEYRDLNPCSNLGSGMVQLVFTYHRISTKTAIGDVTESLFQTLNKAVVSAAYLSQHPSRCWRPGDPRPTPVYHRLYD
jgi:hypothetical protein